MIWLWPFYKIWSCKKYDHICLYVYIFQSNDTIIWHSRVIILFFSVLFCLKQQQSRSCIKSRNKRVAIEIYKADYGDVYCVVADHSSEIGGLCLMKWPSQTLQSLPYFWNTKSHVDFHFSFHATLFFSPNKCPGLCGHRPRHPLGKKWSSTKWKTKKTTWVFIYQKYAKFWSVLLELFVKHKPLISEECD